MLCRRKQAELENDIEDIRNSYKHSFPQLKSFVWDYFAVSHHKDGYFGTLLQIFRLKANTAPYCMFLPKSPHLVLAVALSQIIGSSQNIHIVSSIQVADMILKSANIQKIR